MSPPRERCQSERSYLTSANTLVTTQLTAAGLYFVVYFILSIVLCITNHHSVQTGDCCDHQANTLADLIWRSPWEYRKRSGLEFETLRKWRNGCYVNVKANKYLPVILIMWWKFRVRGNCGGSEEWEQFCPETVNLGCQVRGRSSRNGRSYPQDRMRKDRMPTINFSCFRSPNNHHHCNRLKSLNL